ncbi:hypothetical protein [Glycomyces sp. NRRL B-16210]|uniref:hypothetical protein n=1 Tax=Glycomyces sp. NRRL B-16210 TaxID=1463821 RepID=UPI0004C2713C|nr:hypothetical protein [Glycomyces sp. NRRL B-16210]
MDIGSAMRQRLIDELDLIIRRPGMYSSDGISLQAICSMRLSDLLFLDGTPEMDFHSLGIGAKYGKCGIIGPFHQRFGRERKFYNEVASVFAEIFHQHGYFTPERLVPDEEWSKLVETADTAYVDTDVRMSEILDAFGPPSLKIGRDLLCYAPEDGTGWVFIDCFWETTAAYQPGTGGLGNFTETYDPLVRDIRLPGENFEENLRLTLYGRFLRWGPGWWIYHPNNGQSAEARAIAAQLREVEASDPSQPSHPDL